MQNVEITSIQVVLSSIIETPVFPMLGITIIAT